MGSPDAGQSPNASSIRFFMASALKSPHATSTVRSGWKYPAWAVLTSPTVMASMVAYSVWRPYGLSAPKSIFGNSRSAMSSGSSFRDAIDVRSAVRTSSSLSSAKVGFRIMPTNSRIDSSS